MKTILLLFAFTFVTFNAQSQETVMIKSVETYGSFMSMKISLYVADSNNEIQEFDLSKHNSKGIPNNMITIKSKIDEYLKQGYSIVTSDALSFGWKGVFTVEHTYILQKD